MADIQRFALDSGGNVVNVRDLRGRDGSFSCPHCHGPVIPRMGKVREWHFAHKARTCGYDDYLHSLAEIRIAEWFRKSESVVLDMEGYGICEDCGNCMFTNPDECVTPIRIRHDLKKWYRECEIEKPCGDFVADILCPHESAPLLIEILVTHECSEEKKASGLRIVEIVIESEEDIENIVSSSGLRESEKVRLYGFRRPTVPCGPFERRLTKFILYESGKSWISEGNTNCRDYRYRKRKAVYEIVFGETILPGQDEHLACRALAHRDGFLPKSCDFCFWSAWIDGGWFSEGGRICKLYKRCGNPKWCADNDAARCEMFREDGRLVKECLESTKDFGFHEIWHRENFEPTPPPVVRRRIGPTKSI